MFDPARVVFFHPSGLRPFKDKLFTRVGDYIRKRGGRVVRGDVAAMAAIKPEEVPVVGCMPELTALIHGWVQAKREWAYWDRGYYYRVFATWLPRGENGGMYRWSRNGFQMSAIRDVPGDRFDAHPPPVDPWMSGGSHIVIATPTPTFEKFHRIEGWIPETIRALSTLTDRQLVVRDKATKRPLQADLRGAHCLVAHASIAAVEAAILGCPVFVDRSSAAALVGLTDLSQIERPIRPDRTKWLHSLAASQYDETELVNGYLWQNLA